LISPNGCRGLGSRILQGWALPSTSWRAMRKKMRSAKSVVFSNMKNGEGLEAIIAFIEKQGVLHWVGSVCMSNFHSPQVNPAFLYLFARKISPRCAEAS
jgi:hypothetical protein